MKGNGVRDVPFEVNGLGLVTTGGRCVRHGLVKRDVLPSMVFEGSTGKWCLLGHARGSKLGRPLRGHHIVSHEKRRHKMTHTSEKEV